jgi:hypothetical protein
MNWTTTKDLQQQVQRFWDRGYLLASLLEDEPYFPKRLNFKKPTSKELSDRFGEVRDWINQLRKVRHLRIEMKTVRHPVLGENRIPDSVWLEDLASAVNLLGKQRELQKFTELIEITRSLQPVLLDWVKKHPVKALLLADVWQNLLQVIAWINNNPRPGIYIREVDIPGMDSKFIESHRSILISLLDLVLPQQVINEQARGVAQFALRYGFRQKPLRVRLRILDPAIRILPGEDQDITLTQRDFLKLGQHPEIQNSISKVFITENEINFLSFPVHQNSLVLFGAGYGFAALSAISWLDNCRIYYWGDIDTNGFAILDQLRGKLPEAQSLLMDEQTLLTHRHAWGVEDKPRYSDLQRLTVAENRLYKALCDNEFGKNLRLEQEKISFNYLCQVLLQPV